MNAKTLSLMMALTSLSASAALVNIFEPDFAGTYTGGGANQFTDSYVGNATFANVSVVNTDRFQFQSTHNPALNTLPTTPGMNHSATQLSRNKASAALPFVNNFGVVEFSWRFDDAAWPTTGDATVMSFQIGENFRTGAYSPAGGTGNGPAFVSLSLQSRSSADGRFRFSAGGGPGSTDFNLVRDVGGFFNASFFMAFNNSGSVQSLTAPTGAYNLNDDSIAVWVNGTSVWSNYTHATNIKPLADFENIAFGFGNGTDNIYDTAQLSGGTTQLYDVTVSTIPEPGTLALLGLSGLALALSRRFRK